MRSRLEARWAMFLDALNVRYLYEPTAISTQHGNYLPDFLLPDYEIWVEIKPCAPTKAELDKIQTVAFQKKQLSLLVAGFPVKAEALDYKGSRQQCWGECEFYVTYPDGRSFVVDVVRVMGLLSDSRVKNKVGEALVNAKKQKYHESFLPFKCYLLKTDFPIIESNTYKFNQKVNSERWPASFYKK